MRDPWRIKMREQGYAASKIQGGSRQQAAVWVRAGGRYEWSWKSLRGSRGGKAPKGKSCGKEDTEVKRRSNHFCGRLTGKSHKNLYAMWGVAGKHSIYRDRHWLLRSCSSAAIRPHTMFKPIIELVLSYQLPIQLLQLSCVFF